jgi:hypothetical protein
MLSELHGTPAMRVRATHNFPSTGAVEDFCMTLRQEQPSQANDARGFALVILAYRCAMAEILGAQAKYRVGVWETLEAAAPPGEAEALFGCFFAFARALLAVADRPLQWRQTYCAHLCRDEWLAVAMIDAAQRSDLVAMLSAAGELVGVEEIGDALSAAQALGSALAQRGVYLRPRGGAACANDLCPQRMLH